MSKKDADEVQPEPHHQGHPGTRSWLQKLRSAFKLPSSKKERILTAVGAAVAILLILFSIPYTRYGLLGQVFQRNIVITVQDSRTHKPISDVEVVVGKNKMKTDAKGQAKIARVPVGGWEVVINKRYYNLLSSQIQVPLFGKGKSYKLELVAIGNQVTIKVMNKITGKPLAKASVAALGTTAVTDATGEAVIVLPVKQTKEAGTIKADGYNDLPISITNSEATTPANAFAITPSGKVYFLSKRTGKINVMKSDLDGSNPQIVLTGTGREEEANTILLATRDWKYLALKAKRDSDRAKLYVINTANDKLDIMDEGKAEFSLTGWANHRFVFTVYRADIQYWQPKQVALKSYDAEKDTLKTIDETEAEALSQNWYIVRNITNISLINDSVVYTKDWSGTGYAFNGNQKAAIISANLATGRPTTLKEFADGVSLGLSGKLYEPESMLFDYADYSKSSNSFYEFENGKVTKNDKTNIDAFNQSYPTFVQSPSGEHTFWFEPRDGKNTLFIGNDEGKEQKEVASLSEFAPYGWYSDNYVLVSKKGSELYIAPADFSSAPFKITDYHKPNFNGNGYGGGYGGF
jgi:hypothetical protein